MSDSDEMICYCGQVGRSTILQAIRRGAKTLKDIQQATGAGVGSRCKQLNPKGVCCHGDILALLKEVLGTQSTESGSSGCCCRSKRNH
jgi:bacterioferritin-associated ferredoxin